MPLLLVALAAVTAVYGWRHNWFPFLSNAGANNQLPAGPIVCDVETDMPDALKQSVLAQVASQTNPTTLAAFATTLAQAGYIQSSYCLQYQAWKLSGGTGPAPAAPTAAQIAAAQAARAATANPATLANALTNLGQTSLGQVQLAPGSPAVTVPVGTIIGVTGASVTSNPPGYAVGALPGLIAQLGATGAAADVWSVNAPGQIDFNWTNGQEMTVVTAVAASAATATPTTQPATATGPTPVTTSGYGSGISPQAVAAARQALAQVTAQTEGLG